MKIYIDTHAHLNSEEYNNLDNIVENAKKENVKRIFCVGYDIASSKKALEISEKYEIVYAILGIHPNSINEINKIEELENLLEHHKVIAIGEIGLDFYWNKFDKEVQIEGFKKQIELAIKYNLPVVLHLRDQKDSYKVFELAIGILDGYDLKKVVFHSFSGDKEIARKILDKNYFLSFSGMITYKNPYIIEALKYTNLRNTFFETDSPYLTPPQLGKTINEPKNVKLIYQKASEILNVDVDNLMIEVFENIDKCFNLREREKRMLYEWLYDNETITENMDDESARKFLKDIENDIEKAYKDGILISEIKQSVLNKIKNK
ncbi:MAG: TatD family hydrolase [candidate division WOR-3 bacterium]|nr:TatD family hydrolase [candidate division WOR-3 bacterium]MCX7947870.1 TatD family hydrolase [candidate division WOR-3 bacterium]MDW8150692.1 TatD family hydrolase [candidate division WOR-3 bacterium]